MATSTASTGRHILNAMTTGGAQAAGRHTGQIASGYWADLMALDTQSVTLAGRTKDQLIDSFIFAGDDRLVRDVWSAGRHLVTDGRHIAHNKITSTYRAVLAALHHDL